MNTFLLNYKSTKNELSNIYNKFTDVSLPKNPYIFFYDNLFNKKKNYLLKILFFNIINDSFLLVWKKYFINSSIYYFNYNNKILQKEEFFSLGRMYDIIFINCVVNFEDQISIIKNIYNYVKPEGIIIIENVDNSFIEDNYIERLKNILNYFKEYYFCTIIDENKKLTKNKLFILIKNNNITCNIKKKTTNDFYYNMDYFIENLDMS